MFSEFFLGLLIGNLVICTLFFIVIYKLNIKKSNEVKSFLSRTKYIEKMQETFSEHYKKKQKEFEFEYQNEINKLLTKVKQLEIDKDLLRENLDLSVSLYRLYDIKDYYKHKKNKHLKGSNHNWRYNGKVEAVNELIQEIKKGEEIKTLKKGG